MGEYGADYRLELPIANGVESGELGKFTPQQIGAYAYDPLHVNYLFWIRNTWKGTPEQKWWTGILPYLHSRPPVQTALPQNTTVSGDHRSAADAGGRECGADRIRGS